MRQLTKTLSIPTNYLSLYSNINHKFITVHNTLLFSSIIPSLSSSPNNLRVSRFISTSSSLSIKFSISTHTFQNMDTLFSGGLRIPQVNRQGKIPLSSSDPSITSSSISRTSSDYWIHLLDNPLTQIILLHDLRPILIEYRQTADSDSSANNSLLRLTSVQLQELFPSLFTSVPVTTSSISGNDNTMSKKIFNNSPHILPVCLGIFHNTTPIIALDIGLLFPNRDELQSQLEQYLTKQQPTINSHTAINILFPDAREFLVGSLMKNKVQQKLTKHNDFSPTPPNIYPSSLLTTSDYITNKITNSHLQPSQIEWSLPYEDICLYGTARSVFIWHNRTKYCGTCGSITYPIEGGIKRICSNHPSRINHVSNIPENEPKEISAQHSTKAVVCRETLYPRTDPVVITLVQNSQGTHCLLARSKGFPPSMYSCLAGFVEPGETLEEAAAREVYEETGIIIDNVTYLGSQPWPLGRGTFGQLMIGFIATAKDTYNANNPQQNDFLPKIICDPDELEDAQWYSIDTVLNSFSKWYPSSNQSAVSSPSSSSTSTSTSATTSVASINNSTSSSSSTSSSVTNKIYLPGPFAIAHQLIKEWLKGTRPRL